MEKTKIFLLIVAMFSIISLTACGGGGDGGGGGTSGGGPTSVNLPMTGQTTSYATGDDGTLQRGVAWPNPRFTDNGNGTVKDNLTGLMWMQNAGTPTVGACTGGVRTWQQALDYVACLNTSNYLGYTDWRLPNVNEMESLINAEPPNPDAWLNGQGFSNVQADYYWSSSTYADSPASAWVVTIFGGFVYGDYETNTFYVWPVRAGQ